MAQFVTLDGRQFKDGNGNDWYPMVMDYVFSVYYPEPPAQCDPASFTPDINDLYIAQNGLTGAGLSQECDNPTTCLQQVINDFTAIKNMGFDAIRLTNGPYWFPQEGKFKVLTNCGEENYWGPCQQHLLEFTPPYNADPATSKFLELLDEVIDIAADLNLKIMLDIMLFNDALNSYFDPNMIDPYKEYLNYIGTRYRNNITIFAYVVFEEIQLNDRITNRNKQDICNYTSDLYNELKRVDPNHLISFSGFDARDVTTWDLGAIKMDFYQPHIYPEICNVIPHYQDYNQGIERVAGRLYWLANNCPVPWLVGETGFHANITNNQPPAKWHMDGTETEQASFAEFSLAMNRDCSASGYAWFINQDTWNNYTGILHDDIPTGLGLLRPGLIPTPPPPVLSFEKPAANVFRQYSSNGIPSPVPSSCVKPVHYYDPYNTIYLNLEQENAVYGTIKDEADNPLEDIVIFAWTLQGYDYSVIPIKTLVKTIYTFTDENGNYYFAPFSWKHPQDHNKRKIVKIWGSGVSFNSPNFYKGEYGDQQIPDSNPINFIINSNAINQNAIIQGETFQSNTNSKIFAWNSIAVYNSTFAGSQNNTGLIQLNSRSINLSNETHLSAGSEVYINAQVVTPLCDNFTTQSQEKPPFFPLATQMKNNTQLKIQFQPKSDFYANVFPNPCQTQFTIQINIDNCNQIKYILTDLMGNALLTEFSSSNTINVKVNDLAKGIYLLKLISNDTIIVNKIIIN